MVLEIKQVEDKNQLSRAFKTKIANNILKSLLFLSVLLNLYFNIY